MIYQIFRNEHKFPYFNDISLDIMGKENDFRSLTKLPQVPLESNISKFELFLKSYYL